MAKILVADDNSNIQKMVGLALKDQGIDVVAVGNGEAAVRKISDLKPDLVLADVFMPVRNGYEVCKYVKDDPALQHIPVILLVGAFDPLDEQEAQRVGADGVLKKPFVPPDPLISMVKSALARAGVALGNAPPVEKAPEPAKRSAADLLTPAASKLAALREATKLQEPEPEPFVENFATLPERVKIPEGNEPLAFGSLLETEEAEDDAAFIPAKPPTELGSGAGEWSKDGADDEEIEEEEESSEVGWRPGGDLDAPSLAAIDTTEVENGVSDWREAAFHGSSPSKPGKSHGWAPAIDEPVHAEAASSVGVTTLEAVKPVEPEIPAFSGDAWAAAMSAGVEEKTADLQEAPTEQLPAVVEASATQTPTEELTKEEPVTPAASSDNGWYSVTASPWEVEAKKATRLASTWDSLPVAEPSPATGFSEPVTTREIDEAAEPEAQDQVREIVKEVLSEPVHTTEETLPPQVPVHATAEQEHADVPSVYAATSVNDTQEIETFQPAETKHWESTWVAAPPEVVNQFVDAPKQEFAEVSNEEERVVVPEPDSMLHAHSDEPAISAAETITSEPVHEPRAESTPEHATAAETAPSTDELVARVLARMNPEMLQKMTQELLKPVIAAIVQDEINSKKQ